MNKNSLICSSGLIEERYSYFEAKYGDVYLSCASIDFYSFATKHDHSLMR